MRTSEIRTRWIDYFAANGHEIRPSVPLISPDPSILFTIAGMVPFIPYILHLGRVPLACKSASVLTTSTMSVRPRVTVLSSR